MTISVKDMTAYDISDDGRTVTLSLAARPLAIRSPRETYAGPCALAYC